METILSAPKRAGRARSPSAPPPTRRRAVRTKRKRLKIIVRGAVQGVGFRPFVYRLATELELNGWVSNTAQGVFIEVEGSSDLLREFRLRIERDKPAHALVQSIESLFLDSVGYDAFEICESEEGGAKTAFILPDIATCRDCLDEILDPNNRRFRYPFTNCTNCGPRFSIIEALPYDRANTSMKKFAMCDECEREYHDPLDRRFHAQPNACPTCGPQLQLWSEDGEPIAMRQDALRYAAEAVRAGKIVALKGLGGFQLIVDARNDAAVLPLRERKHREEKPFALMYPSLEAIRADCEIAKLEQRLLLSPEAPIVLLVGRDRPARRASFQGRLMSGSPQRRTRDRRSLDALAESVSPRNPNLGVMLPYSALHHLLMRELNFPIVATSGNLSDEPICIDEREALQRLHAIADVFLVHDRPIVRHVDDSVVRVMCGREMVLRRARGYAPLPISVGRHCQAPNKGVSQNGAGGSRAPWTGGSLDRASGGERVKRPTILAFGAHLKNTIALKVDDNVFLSQHIGDLETKQAYVAFRRAAADLPRLYDASIDTVGCDLHPDYLSTKQADDFAGRAGSPLPAADGAHGVTRPTKISVQHHFAHVVACMAENGIEPPVLGIAWDGTGYGLDATIWGGEFLLAKPDGSFERVAHLRPFLLPGGDRAIKEPRRSGLGLLYEIFSEGAWDFSQLFTGLSEQEKLLLRQMLEKKINAPLTSSAGRLFDAVAALTGLRQRASFEGQAAMELEFARREGVRDAYSFVVKDGTPMVVDWEPAIRELLSDVGKREDVGAIAAKFHNGLIEAAVDVAEKVGERKIVLSGGCFQNRYLTERAVERLREEKFHPYWHQRIPPNDGGIALGQAVAASWRS
jgi:hydrogenase maturation protein HypF